jgi:hypothetical protein
MGGGMQMSFGALACLFFLSFLQQAAAGGSGFVKTEGTHFSVNGNPLFVNGFNSYWLMTMATDPTQRNKVTSAFEQAAAHGLNVARTWAFNDGQYKALQTSPGVYDEQVFQVCAWGPCNTSSLQDLHPFFFSEFCFWVSGSVGIVCFSDFCGCFGFSVL